MHLYRINKPISLLIITLFAISFAAVSISQAADAQALKGEVVSVDPNTGMLEVMSPEGKTIMLNAGEQIEDLKTLQKGDQVMIEYDKDKTVKSINKEG
jgi:c-di-GMP-binding flagellar brake protein YcgR